jgi:hypothetical protein
MHLPDVLHDLPSTVVFAVFMGVAGLLAAAACVVFAPVMRAPQTKEMLDVAMRTTGAITAALTLTLAFCAVQARSQMADAQRLVQAEANAIAGLARMAHRIGVPGHALLPAISAYVAEISGGELPAMAREGRHAATQRRAEALEDAVYAASAALTSSLAEDLIDQADQVEATREARLQAAQAALPSQFWVLIMLLGALLVATGPLYPRRGHVVLMLAIQSAALAALVAFVFLMDQPFRGEFRVSAEPFHVLERSLEHRGGLAPARLVRH